MSFWNSGTGKAVTGKAEDAFTGDFSIIPNNTMALASIKSIKLSETKNGEGNTEDCYLVTWKIEDENFMGRLVTQKIKVFSGSPEQIQRNLNMFKLLLDLCEYKPKHANAPTEEELSSIQGKILGIQVREWHMPKKEGGMMSGNFVAEIHATSGFEPKVGKVLEVKVNEGVESALTRQSRAKQPDMHFQDDSIPF
jgi:hypothetical protein